MAEVLIVEDDPLLALDLGHEVEQLGYQVVALAESADEAMIAYMEYRPDLVVMDINIFGTADGAPSLSLRPLRRCAPRTHFTRSCHPSLRTATRTSIWRFSNESDWRTGSRY